MQFGITNPGACQRSVLPPAAAATRSADSAVHVGTLSQRSNTQQRGDNSNENTHTHTLAFASSYAASAPIATSRSLHWLLCSAMSVQRCTAMATASTRCVPMIAASRHVLWLPAEW